jgi:DNA repair and recombination protein RAD54B
MSHTLWGDADLSSLSLLGQNPYAGPTAAARKVLIVCPVSLIQVLVHSFLQVRVGLGVVADILYTMQNWKGEFHKWLGKDRLGVTACNNDKVNIDQFFYK